jgi:ketosteroid isomerase-like protein
MLMMKHDTKAIAIAFQHHLASATWDRASALLADDAIIISVDGAESGWSSLRAMLEAAWAQLEQPFEIEIVGVTAEADRVALEMIGRARLKNGKRYQNHYHFLYIFRDGKISRMKEYCDPRAHQVFEE